MRIEFGESDRTYATVVGSQNQGVQELLTYGPNFREPSRRCHYGEMRLPELTAGPKTLLDFDVFKNRGLFKAPNGLKRRSE